MPQKENALCVVLSAAVTNTTAKQPRSRNHFCNGNATVPSGCVAELHVTAHDIKILSVAHKRFYGDFMLLATINGTMSSEQENYFSAANCT